MKLQLSENIEGWIFLRVESDKLEEYLKYYKSKDCDTIGIAVSRFHGYKLDDLNFLSSIPQLKALYLQDSIPGISTIQSLNELQWLLLPESKQKLDLSNFPKLEVIRGSWNSKLKNLSSCNSLHTISLSKYNPINKDIREFSYLSKLEELEINQSTIECLKGVEKIANLRSLEVSYMPRLQDISSISGLKCSLEKLRFRNCKKVASFEVIDELEHLKELGINNCGDVTSIKFIEYLKRLEHFSFVNTNVVNGDLSPCLKLKNLRHVGFLDKRHYSHKLSEIEANLKSRSKKKGLPSDFVITEI
jgi:hypothetical protein